MGVTQRVRVRGIITCASKSRASSRVHVVLPLPDGPTSATEPPGRMRRLRRRTPTPTPTPTPAVVAPPPPPPPLSAPPPTA